MLFEEGDIWKKARNKAYQSLAETGLIISFVGMVNGKVVCKVLSTTEIFELLDLYDNIQDIPEEYNIFSIINYDLL